MLSEALCLLAIMKGCRCKVLQQYLEYLSSHYILFFFFFFISSLFCGCLQFSYWPNAGRIERVTRKLSICVHLNLVLPAEVCVFGKGR